MKNRKRSSYIGLRNLSGCGTDDTAHSQEPDELIEVPGRMPDGRRVTPLSTGSSLRRCLEYLPLWCRLRYSCNITGRGSDLVTSSAPLTKGDGENKEPGPTVHFDGLSGAVACTTAVLTAAPGVGQTQRRR